MTLNGTRWCLDKLNCLSLLIVIGIHSRLKYIILHSESCHINLIKLYFYLKSPDAQRNGINFIYDMNNCKRSNYDLSLSQKILTLVRVNILCLKLRKKMQ